MRPKFGQSEPVPCFTPGQAREWRGSHDRDDKDGFAAVTARGRRKTSPRHLIVIILHPLHHRIAHWAGSGVVNCQRVSELRPARAPAVRLRFPLQGQEGTTHRPRSPATALPTACRESRSPHPLDTREHG